MAHQDLIAEMQRVALDAASAFYSTHQAEMSTHELVDATHLLHSLALALERSSAWSEKRKQKRQASAPVASPTAQKTTIKSKVEAVHSLESLEEALHERPGFEAPPEHVEPVRKPPLPVAAPTPVAAPRPRAASPLPQPPAPEPTKNLPGTRPKLIMPQSRIVTPHSVNGASARTTS